MKTIQRKAQGPSRMNKEKYTKIDQNKIPENK